MAFPDSFVTRRLKAERLTAGHLSELRRMHTDAAVMAYLGGVQTEAQTAEYLQRNLQHWDDYGFGLWILHEIGGGPPVGRATLRHLTVDGDDDVEVGYGFYEPYWGQGYATETALACVELGREELHLPTLVGVAAPQNIASQRVLRKAGLVYERECLLGGAPIFLFRIGTR